MSTKWDHKQKWDHKPDFSDILGKAWLIDFEGMGVKDDPRAEGTLNANYLLFCPSAHPMWSWHVMFGISLRDIPGVEPAKKQSPDMTHELMVWALDPNKEVPDPKKWKEREQGLYLQPPDTVVQFGGVNDEQATEILHQAAKACVAGVLVPDSDYHRSWVSTIRATASHYEQGLH